MRHKLLTRCSLGTNLEKRRVSLHLDRSIAHALHVLANLLGNLFQYLLSEVTSGQALLELHELHNVAHGCFTLTTEHRTVAIQLLHHCELLIANANDDYTRWQLR
jgi:hypothetical protein